MKDDALAAEDAARAVPGVTNSSGSSASFGMGGLVLATSHGFVGHYTATRFSRSVSAIAGEGTGMGRDDTIYARRAGVVDFKQGRAGRTISVLPQSDA